MPSCGLARRPRRNNLICSRMELARSMPTPFHALRIMKSFIADYLSLPFDKAPLKFWQMLFPLPYKDDVVRNAKAHDLDPYSVAALIRQETEFNPAAHSHANAYGLMQLVPATGRQMARQQGIRSRRHEHAARSGRQYSAGNALPARSAECLGRRLGPDAGRVQCRAGRVHQWLTWSTYKEPAEFVENIPFNETRDYVQAVLRNADMYRTIYGQPHPVIAEAKDTSDVPPVNLSSSAAGGADAGRRCERPWCRLPGAPGNCDSARPHGGLRSKTAPRKARPKRTSPRSRG